MALRLLSTEPETQEGGDADMAAAMAHLQRQFAIHDPEAPPERRLVYKRALPDREILAALTGLGALLTVRLLLAVAVCGAIALAWQAVPQATDRGLYVLVAYAVTIVGPLVWLSTRRV